MVCNAKQEGGGESECGGAGRAHIGDSVGDEEWGDLLVALLDQVLDSVLEDGQASHTAAYQNARACLVQLLKRFAALLQPSVRQCLHSVQSIPSGAGSFSAQGHGLISFGDRKSQQV